MNLENMKLIVPIVTTIIAFILNKIFRDKSKLLAYYIHASSNSLKVNNIENITIYEINSKTVYNNGQYYLDRTNFNLYKHMKGENKEIDIIDKIKLKDKISDILEKNSNLIVLSPEDFCDVVTKNGGHIPDQIDLYINTHAIVVSNFGNSQTKNITIGHSQFLPSYSIYPNIEHEVINLNGEGKAIKIKNLAPKQEIIISYMYFPPKMFNQIGTYIKSDEEGDVQIISKLQTNKTSNIKIILISIPSILVVSYILYHIIEFIYELNKIIQK
ncbi:hypothetical protein [Silvanigrella aquatica]|uniref:Uncharacterized protein n=1 Tax=Silvanigrella aquatica TaxID=1915309 RepID=A0A1L4D4Z0_9BACT|nr:hypothetical protein [Silvanigrella aquatica]APJ05258.1 hypothetical protein AXG55_14650 [Silvanigrella aquatica]